MKPIGYDSGEPLETGQNSMTAAYPFRLDLRRSAGGLKGEGRDMDLRSRNSLQSHCTHAYARTNDRAPIHTQASEKQPGGVPCEASRSALEKRSIHRHAHAHASTDVHPRAHTCEEHTDMRKYTQAQTYTHKRTPAMLRGTAQ